MKDLPSRFTVNSEKSFADFCSWCRSFYDEHKYVTWSKPAIGPDRSIDQNSLLHLWCAQYCSFLLKKNIKSVTPGEIEGMKRAAKGAFFKENRHQWMVHKVINPKTGQEKNDFTSSKNWKHDNMYEFLGWLQGHAASEDGLVLESKGKFLKDQRRDR